MQSPLRQIFTLAMLCLIAGRADASGGISTPERYISPGVQIGWEFGKGLFWGMQLTGGAKSSSLRLADGSQGYGGVTVGFRQSPSRGWWAYCDAQASWTAAGAGAGLVYAGGGSDPTHGRFGVRAKAWAGLLALGTADAAFFSGDDVALSMGGMLVFPIATQN